MDEDKPKFQRRLTNKEWAAQRAYTVTLSRMLEAAVKAKPATTSDAEDTKPA